MENTADEIKRLQGCINDLISILALPALWSGRESSERIKTLLDVLVGMLRLDFAYARLNDSIDGPPVELILLAERQQPNIQPREVGRALARWLTGEAGGPPVVVPNPVGEGQVSIALFRLGLQYEMGVLVAGSQRSDFPTNIEMLLLRVAANQAAISLQEAQRLYKQKRAAEELEQRVAERTTELTGVNEELKVEIAERERAEQEQQKLVSLVENSTDFIGFTSLEREALFINRAGRKMVGLDEGESLRTDIIEYVAEQDKERVRQEILPTVEREGQWEGEVRFRNFKTGAAIPMLNHLFFIKEPGSNRRLALATISRDITERKRAESELLALKDEMAAELESMTRLHEFSTRLIANTELQLLLEEILTVTIALQDTGFGLVHLYNPDTKTLDIVAQRGFRQDFLDHFSSAHEDSSACERALQRQERVVIEDVQTDAGFKPHRQIAASAGFRAVQSTPLFSRNGEPLGVISTHFRRPHRPSEHELRLTDLYARQAAEMIEHKRAEAALRRSAAFLAEGQRISHTGSWGWNVSTGDLFWSLEHFRIFGFDPRNVKPSYPMYLQRVHRQDLHFVKQTIDKAVRERSDFEMEYRIVLPGGTIRCVHTLGHPVVKESGNEDEFIGTVVDVTERKQAEEALKKAQAELAHITRVTALGELTASIAHEVNQPLAAIVTNGQACLRLLSHDKPDMEGALECIEATISDAMRASEVIKRIRALLKKTAPEKVPLNINDTIQEVILLAASELVKNQVLLRTELGADLPPVLGDRIQMQQVLLNLILNANEAMSGTGWKPRELLIWSRKSKPEQVIVAVRDSGPGLDPQTAERIFDAFFSTKNHDGGLGLGLSISRTIIESHGGKLWATPNEGKGATFQFTLSTRGAR